LGKEAIWGLFYAVRARQQLAMRRRRRREGECTTLSLLLSVGKDCCLIIGSFVFAPFILTGINSLEASADRKVWLNNE
jgi:hypothetical protein